jgi:FdhD protein
MTANAVRRTVTPVRVVAVRTDHYLEVPDRLATEEPMEIRAAGPGQPAQQVTVTMRTPGHDFELAAGFLLTEGLIDGPADVAAVKYCELPPDEEQQFNIVTVELARPYEPGEWGRAFGVNSSCGVCGKVALDQIEVRCDPVSSALVVPASLIPTLPNRLSEAQRLFAQTGGLHAAALFGSDGTLECLREDVGRHNAVDKIVGHAVLQHRLPLDLSVLMVSGRVSFEIVQKAAIAGVPVIAAVSAPSSLAVEAAERLGVTLAGFVRGGMFNLYTRRERVDLGS